MTREQGYRIVRTRKMGPVGGYEVDSCRVLGFFSFAFWSGGRLLVGVSSLFWGSKLDR